MPRKDEIDRMLVLLYRSSNAHGYTNFSRPIDWLDKLPMAGLEELDAMLENFRVDVQEEMARRLADGMPRYSREHYETEEAERAAGAALLSGIGISSERPN